MSDKLMSVIFRKDGEDAIQVSTKFHGDVSVAQMFDMCGKAIQGLLETCYKLGTVKGLTEEQITEAVLGK